MPLGSEVSWGDNKDGDLGAMPSCKELGAGLEDSIYPAISKAVSVNSGRPLKELWGSFEWVLGGVRQVWS